MFCLYENLQVMLNHSYSAAKFQSSDLVSHPEILGTEYIT